VFPAVWLVGFSSQPAVTECDGEGVDDRFPAHRPSGAACAGGDYQQWLRNLRESLAQGAYPPSLRADLGRIVAKVQQAVSGACVDMGLEVGTGGLTLAIPGAGARVFGFVRQNLPGGRYQKLMYRSIMAQLNYPDIAMRLGQLWTAPPHRRHGQVAYLARRNQVKARTGLNVRGSLRG
jgi:hypothetical protein